MIAGFPAETIIEREVNSMKRKQDPTKAAVSAASVKGNAGPSPEQGGKNKVNSQNNQYKR
jgi:hypothetical protein